MKCSKILKSKRCSETDTIVCAFHARGSECQPGFTAKNNVGLQKREHKAKLASEEEHLHDVDAESRGDSELSLSATPSPSSPLQPPVPPPVPPPRAVRRLPMDDQQAANFLPPRSPSPESAASPVVEEAQASPKAGGAAAAAAACCQSYLNRPTRVFFFRTSFTRSSA